MKDFIYEEFKNRVADFGITVGPEAPNGDIKIKYANSDITINLTNAKHSYAKDGDLTHLERIISSLHNTLMGRAVPDWEEVSSNLFFMLSSPPSGPEVKEDTFITESIAEGVIKVFVYHRKGTFMWITHNMLEKWNISLETLKALVDYNMDIMLDNSEIMVTQLPDRVKFGGMNAELSWLNSAMLFTKNFKKKVERKIGWPLYFGMPTREFCNFVHVKNKPALEILGEMFDDIYRHEDLHLTRDLYSMTDNGIRVVGKF